MRLILIALLFMASQVSAQEFINSSGLWIENFDSTNTADNRYTIDNKLYKDGTIIKYQFKYFNNMGNEQYFVINDDNNWIITSSPENMNNVVSRVEMVVLPGLSPMIKLNPNYNQTCIDFVTYKMDGSVFTTSHTGMIENSKNIWIHPPRDGLFRILNLNPYPMLKYPIKTGDNWKWELSTSSYWSDPLWKEWDGRIQWTHIYNVLEEGIFEIAGNKIKCLIISAIGQSDLGRTELRSYYNKEYGFIKFEYTNVDGSKIHLIRQL